jgi:hypothetical protein
MHSDVLNKMHQCLCLFSFFLRAAYSKPSLHQTPMPDYYKGPNNSAKLKAVTLTLLASATILVIWRISWRLWKKVIGLPDYLLMVGLVSVMQLNIVCYIY